MWHSAEERLHRVTSGNLPSRLLAPDAFKKKKEKMNKEGSQGVGRALCHSVCEQLKDAN